MTLFVMVCSMPVLYVRLFCRAQDLLQTLSMFAQIKLNWPPSVMQLFNSLSALNFNIDLLAPECNLTINFEAKWYIVQAVPLVLLAGIVLVFLTVRLLQLLQSKLLKRLPFGALAAQSLVDVSVGVMISGTFILYLGNDVSLLFARPCDLHRRAVRLHPPCSM
jgi:hypothetical protein